MKIAALSDIHGNLPALKAVLADITRDGGVDHVVNLGDILSGPLAVAETAGFLMALPQIVTIAGNHERQLLAQFDRSPSEIDAGTSDGHAALAIDRPVADWLRGLPAKHWLTGDVLLVHGTPGSDLDYWLETVVPTVGVHGSRGVRPATPAEVRMRLLHGGGTAQRASLVLCGHTHVPRVVRCGQTLVVNPGSVGLPAYADERPHPHRVENDAPHARYAILERPPARPGHERHGEWQVRLCAVPYEFGSMTALAAQRGRPDWAHAIATGRMPDPLPVPAAASED